jgi:hypothetical protein
VKRNALLSAILMTAVAVFLTGCSRNPVAPITGAPSTPDAAPTVIAQLPEDTPPVDGGTPSWRSVTVNKNSEGVITVGRFTLWLRKNSLKQDATITLRVTNPEALDVVMEVSPASANNFGSPAILTANMSDIANVDYDTTTMLYWDGSWEAMADVAAHPNQENVVAHLDHLSNCKVTMGGGATNKASL